MELRTLEEVAKVIMGTSPAGNTYNRDGIGLPLLNGPTEFGNVYPQSTLYTTDSKKECIPGDLIFCVRGNTTGRMNWADKQYSLGRGVCAIRGNTSLDTMYIKVCLELLLPELLQMASGATMPNLTQNSIKKFPIPYPEHRKKIATILSAYDDLIENNLRRIKVLEEMAQNLYREWFVNFRFPGHEKARFVDSPLGRIPEGWEAKRLGELLSGHIGGGWGKDEQDDKYTEPAWVIRGTDIPNTRLCNISNVPYRYHTVSNLKARKLFPGDIIFEVSGGSKGQPLGRTLLVSPELLRLFKGEKIICASFCKRIEPNFELYVPEILYLSFIEGYRSGEIEQFQVQSTGISNFRWSEYIEKVCRIVPPITAQESFQDIVTPIISQIALLGQKNHTLRQTRDLLLPKLISGEVDVSELDISVSEEVSA
jgi:type I restriction enzyme, S subunit